MSVLFWILFALVWLGMTFVTYKTVLKNWKQTEFEKIWLSFVWPCTGILFGIHVFYNKVILGKE